MSIEVQLRRGTAAENAAFTGQEGELVYTTDTKDLYVHDGSTAGGNPVGSYPSADATKVGFITVTQAVNLDTMESNIATNNAKVGLTNGSVDSDKLSTTLDFGSIA